LSLMSAPRRTSVKHDVYWLSLKLNGKLVQTPSFAHAAPVLAPSGHR